MSMDELFPVDDKELEHLRKSIAEVNKKPRFTSALLSLLENYVGEQILINDRGNDWSGPNSKFTNEINEFKESIREIVREELKKQPHKKDISDSKEQQRLKELEKLIEEKRLEWYKEDEVRQIWKI